MSTPTPIAVHNNQCNKLDEVAKQSPQQQEKVTRQ
jgi:hypothetical protein